MEIAEAWAVLRNLILYYTAIKRSKLQLSYFGRVVINILSMVETFSQVNFTWTNRSGNEVAHSSTFFDLFCETFFFSSKIPDFIVNVVDADLRHVLLIY